MARYHLNLLQLQDSQVVNLADFLESYARTCLDELETGLPGLSEGSVWTLRMDAATTLREAASWAAYLDVPRSLRLLRESGRLYRQAGLAFGAFLLAVADEALINERDEMLQELEDSLTSPGAGASSDAETSTTARTPQQQAYLFLTCAALGERRSLVSGSGQSRLRQLALSSPNRQAVVPFGSLGMPLRDVWDFGVRLLDPEPGRSLGAVTGHLVIMCQRYAESISLAMVNDHLWRRGAAPVDVGDIEIIGMTSMATRRYGGEQLRAQFDERYRGREEIARVPFELGLEMAEPSAGPHDQDRL